MSGQMQLQLPPLWPYNWIFWYVTYIHELTVSKRCFQSWQIVFFFRKNQSFFKIYTSVIWCNPKPYGINNIKVWRVFFFYQNITNSILYSAVIFVVAFVVFFGLFSGTYFYKHCIKQTSISDGKQLDSICNQQERYKILLQSSNIERQNNSNSVHLEPISSVFYEEIERYADTDN